MKGKRLYSPIDMNAAFKRLLHAEAWNESRVSYWVTRSEKLIRRTLTMSPEDQKREIEDAGENPIFSYNQTDYIKERVAVEVQFGKALLRPSSLVSPPIGSTIAAFPHDSH